jgi:hypothetical protein
MLSSISFKPVVEFLGENILPKVLDKNAGDCSILNELLKPQNDYKRCITVGLGLLYTLVCTDIFEISNMRRTISPPNLKIDNTKKKESFKPDLDLVHSLIRILAFQYQEKFVYLDIHLVGKLLSKLLESELLQNNPGIGEIIDQVRFSYIRRSLCGEIVF